MDEQVGSYLHIILETPDSGAFKYLENALANSFENSLFYIPRTKIEERVAKESDNILVWDDRDIACFTLDEGSLINSNSESFLFFSSFLEISAQFEHLILELENQPSYKIGRVVSFIDAEKLCKISAMLQSWLDAVAHFSDVLCITNRNNKNGKAVGSLLKRYEDMRYPLESYIISNSKSAKISNILNPTARRISHIFDSPELLENEETPLSDPYLKKLPNGNRAKPIPMLFSKD